MHQFREILIHLVTITIGLLIATQIESCVEWRRHVHMAAEARASLRTEIESNLKSMKASLPVLRQDEKGVSEGLAFLDQVLQHDRKAARRAARRDGTLAANFHMVGLADTAWKTAQETGALGYMSYEEAEYYAVFYRTQNQLAELSDQAQQDAFAIAGISRRYHLADETELPVDQAGQLAEKLQLMQIHILLTESILQANIHLSEEFLKNGTKGGINEAWTNSGGSKSE
jgi:hypothetical protein